MKFKKTRIAFSALCGILCLLLIAVWVRSYWWADAYILASPRGKWELSVCSAVERVLLHFGEVNLNSDDGLRLQSRSEPVDNWKSILFNIEQGFCVAQDDAYCEPFLGFGVGPNQYGYELLSPHWFAVALIAIVAFAPWINWRFSLRALLLLTTLVALLLAKILYFASD